jgi:hypothetical protein
MPTSERTRTILEAIAKGHSYEQILVQDPAFTYHDIFHAAAEALQLASATAPSKAYDLTEIRQDHPRAYEPWTPEDDNQLRQLFHAGVSQEQMSKALQRQCSAIRSRLMKLHLGI